MINTKNKTTAFILFVGMSIVSWIIFISNFFLQLATLFQVNFSNISLGSFLFVTILVSIYSFVIPFKIRAKTYYPLIIAFLHYVSLQGSILLPIYLAIDLIVLLLLNFGSKEPIDTNKSFYQENHHIKSDDIIDVEYTEH